MNTFVNGTMINTTYELVFGQLLHNSIYPGAHSTSVNEEVFKRG